MNNRHLVIEQGGSRAILTGLGATLALRLSGLKQWSTIGGISGGAIPALLLADNADPLNLIETTMALDFMKLLLPAKGGSDPLRPFATELDGQRSVAHKFVARMLRRGLRHTDGLGELIDSQVKTWPEAFWTMAVSENSHVMFTSTGVYEYGFDGSFTVLSDEPAPLSLAIRATCAIPGLLQAVVYQGRYLFDGALSQFGSCPTAWVHKHFSGGAGTVVRVASTGKDSRKNAFLCRVGRRLLCRDSSKMDFKDEGKADIDINAHVPDVHAMRFKLTELQKQSGLIAGFNATVMELTKNHGLFQEGINPLTSCADFGHLLEMIRQCA
ncbi:MAG: patatin-like phospholipase family protein [Candidatus Melainabacteria bacterium]|nr:patatin-like phospholipase family protein [Candidatus Melainabacteria bacterium]